jgi:hypothetical protein
MILYDFFDHDKICPMSAFWAGHVGPYVPGHALMCPNYKLTRSRLPRSPKATFEVYMIHLSYNHVFIHRYLDRYKQKMYPAPVHSNAY